MKLSVVIVNYNVKHFLEQALQSVRRAAVGLDVEVWVVDNDSADGSVDMLRQKFPEVRLIANKKNVGFATANNQAISQASGKYILLLNPDTVVAEDTFAKTLEFMEQTPDAGALGVRMYDGKGNYLPESKRGLPDPAVAFFKMSGLGALFPKSRRFNYYYMGHLDGNQTQQVEILSGAFMLLRKSVLDQTGLLDESFFMYGEDIDLSYRVLQAGYKNYYFPHTRIIHYKGESTKKGSLNYVRMFYNAMMVFAQKHYAHNKARTYILGLKCAIYFKAALVMVGNLLRRLAAPLLDAAAIYAGMWLIKVFWQSNIKNAPDYYPPEYMLVNVPLYTAIWLCGIYFSGGYDRPSSLWRVARGLLFGTLLISAVYGFLPEALRFSRGMIVLGAAWAFFATAAWRMTAHFLKHKNLSFGSRRQKRTIIVGSPAESGRVANLLRQSMANTDLIGYVLASDAENAAAPAPESGYAPANMERLGSIGRLPEIAGIYKIDEIIFCAQSLPSQTIMQYMIDIGAETDYKIVPPESLSIIGSNSKNTAGDLYAININFNLNQARNRRNKRVLDLFLCLVFLLAMPLLLLYVKGKKGFVKNWASVLLGKKTWVGYAGASQPDVARHLPKLKAGVLSPVDVLPNTAERGYGPETLRRLNLLYAKDYHIGNDLQTVWKGLRQTGRQPME